MYLERIKSPEDLKKLSVLELEQYADEARNFIIETVKKNGGHLASNLGCVELTIALHYIFNSPKDKLVFDVGHQSYTHKLITGRYEGLKNLRTNRGVSGFPNINESEHDIFTSGHSSNSLSFCLGLAKGRDLLNENNEILPIIGDGAFTGGMVYEALNDIGESQSKLIIILNDNKMSISKNVGAISKYFARLRLSLKYNKLKQNVRKCISTVTSLNSRNNANKSKLLDSFKGRIRNLVSANRLFENFGIRYYGPFDGHNIGQMLEVFKKVSLKNEPSIIHLITQKGRGYKDAENAPDKFHAYPLEEKENLFSIALGESLVEIAKKDEKLVAVTAAMSNGTGLDIFQRQFEKRYFDVSIAEQHAVSMCGGLSLAGFKPIFAVYSTFLQRGFDQIIHEICINNLGVTFAIDRAGVVGSDGVTHQGIFDLSYLNLIPNLTIVSAKDGNELKEFLYFAKDFNKPLAIRYPKSYKKNYEKCEKIVFGKWEQLKKSESGVYILAVGNRMLDLAFEAESDANIVNCRFIKPLDYEFLDSINKEGNLIITLEDNVKKGGFGESVLSYCNKMKAEIIILSHRDEFLNNHNIADSLIKSGLEAKNLNKIISSFSCKNFDSNI